MSKDDLEFHGGNLLSGLVNYATLGTVGYNGKTGKLDTQEGVTTAFLDESFGEISGRNQGREDKYNNDKKIQAENALREQEQVNLRERDRQNDINASMSAAGTRNTVAARNAAASGTSSISGVTSSLGTDEKDFLGL